MKALVHHGPEQRASEPRGFTGVATAAPHEVPAGTERRDLVCRECGYGIRISKPAPRCPMCHRSDWQPLATGQEPLGRFEP
jgi:rubrerythrin